MKILVCDDRRPGDMVAAIHEAEEELGTSLNPQPIDPKDLRENIAAFLERVKRIIAGAVDADDSDVSIFQSTDILLLDHGLSAFDEFPFRLTADHLAGYLRAFSSASYVVALNKFDTNFTRVDFDLKFLIGDVDTKADLALNTRHLGSAGLWNGKPPAGEFCPWYWPALSRVGNRRAEQIRIVEKNLDRPMLDVLGFPPEAIPLLSRQAVGYLSSGAHSEAERIGARDIREVTFWNHFQNSNRTLPKEDRVDLVSNAGGDLDAAKSPANGRVRHIISRVVAAEIDFWFRRDIVGPQKVLLDPPHLQARYRFRTDQGARHVDVWSQTAHEREPPYGLDSAFFKALPPRALFLGVPWLDSPTFWGHLLEETNDITKLEESAEHQTGFVFCEDTRRFRDRASSEPPQRFVTELGKGVDVRFVERLPNYDYSPASLLAR